MDRNTLNKYYPAAANEFIILNCKSVRLKNFTTAILALYREDMGDKNVGNNCRRIPGGD
jgi:hypothetical protein